MSARLREVRKNVCKSCMLAASNRCRAWGIEEEQYRAMPHVKSAFSCCFDMLTSLLLCSYISLRRTIRYHLAIVTTVLWLLYYTCMYRTPSKVLLYFTLPSGHQAMREEMITCTLHRHLWYNLHVQKLYRVSCFHGHASYPKTLQSLAVNLVQWMRLPSKCYLS